MSLSVVHFSTADREGGSGRAAYRIHDGLRRRGHVSRMLVSYKVTDDADVDTVSGGGLWRLADRAATRLTDRLGWQYRAMPSGHRLRRHPWVAGAQVFQLYNTHGGYFGQPMLPWLSRRAPVVWRLSDMWAMTGHCAYAGACERWRSGCGDCPDLGGYPAIGRDTTARLWALKDRLYAKSDITVVAPSSWTERLARESPLLGRFPVHRIPNGLDLTVFRPLDRAAARAVLGLEGERLGILFAANVARDNARKGSDTLEAALHRLGPRDDLDLLVAGVGAADWVGRVPQRVVPLGYLRDDRLIAAAYAASAMVVVPSAVENLPNTLLEANACGRPSIAFDAGGMADGLRHQDTGLLVPPGDVDGLAAALARLADDPAARARMGAAALALARAEFSSDVQAQRFEALYQTLVEARR
jgi:glycosyltransferase involved in cell wall biosynthesis